MSCRRADLRDRPAVVQQRHMLAATAVSTLRRKCLAVQLPRGSELVRSAYGRKGLPDPHCPHAGLVFPARWHRARACTTPGATRNQRRPPCPARTGIMMRRGAATAGKPRAGGSPCPGGRPSAAGGSARAAPKAALWPAAEAASLEPARPPAAIEPAVCRRYSPGASDTAPLTPGDGPKRWSGPTRNCSRGAAAKH